MRRLDIIAAAGVGLLAACKAQQASVDPPPVNKVVEPEPEVDKDMAHPLSPESAQRLAASMTRHPEPFLAVHGAKSARPLRADLGKPVTFELAIPGIARWADANIARFVVRSAGGVQQDVPIDAVARRGLTASYTFSSAGPAMLMMCAGPQSMGAGWAAATHCTKLVLDVAGPRPNAEENGDFTGETGLPIDVVPLVSPARLAVGDVLPVSFHFMNEEEGNAPVLAVRPDGSVDRQITSRAGVAHFAMSQPGRWVVRFATEQPDGDRIGELVFEVGEARR